MHRIHPQHWRVGAYLITWCAQAQRCRRPPRCQMNGNPNVVWMVIFVGSVQQHFDKTSTTLGKRGGASRLPMHVAHSEPSVACVMLKCGLLFVICLLKSWQREVLKWHRAHHPLAKIMLHHVLYGFSFARSTCALISTWFQRFLKMSND